MLTLKVKKLNYFQSLIGLIGKSHPEPVLIKTRFGIHTFGLKFPIDVLVLDKTNEENIYKIIKIKQNLPPNRFFFWNLHYSIIIEIPQNNNLNINYKPNNVLKTLY